MSNDTRPLAAHSSARSQSPTEPQLLGPQQLLRPSALAAGATVLIAAFTAYHLLSELKPGADNDSRDLTKEAVLTIPADKAHGAFTVLASNFQQSPGSVLVQLKMSEAEKQRLAEKLADGSVRLAAVTVWDTMDEDGDIVEISAAGFSQRVTIMHKPATFFLPLHPGGNVTIRAVRDGYGGITLGVRTITGNLPLPRLAVGQTLEIPAL
ncbi:hypothetical protein JQ628_16345 [Bradyrhizobium lablabi]|uniref:hypothetical protein n=1 Tax=Bradyrhizobium lablabi TaxID=722472 RepID=UPI001BA61DAE|nr:hypothetical protein [Bradyrhizobium lablabi]MBR1123098.1 hypothetical protein [Bradyrhizobium lablabi]